MNYDIELIGMDCLLNLAQSHEYIAETTNVKFRTLTVCILVMFSDIIRHGSTHGDIVYYIFYAYSSLV